MGCCRTVARRPANGRPPRPRQVEGVVIGLAGGGMGDGGRAGPGPMAAGVNTARRRPIQASTSSLWGAAWRLRHPRHGLASGQGCWMAGPPSQSRQRPMRQVAGTLRGRREDEPAGSRSGSTHVLKCRTAAALARCRARTDHGRRLARRTCRTPASALPAHLEGKAPPVTTCLVSKPGRATAALRVLSRQRFIRGSDFESSSSLTGVPVAPPGPCRPRPARSR